MRSIRQPHRYAHPLLAGVIFLLLFGGVGLIALSCAARPPGDARSVPAAVPRPSPTWAPFPTRVRPTPTATATIEQPSDLALLHQALLHGDVAEAQRIWDRSFTTFDEGLDPDAVTVTEFIRPDGSVMVEEMIPTAEGPAAPPHSADEAEVYRAGARLALMQQDYGMAQARIVRALALEPEEAGTWSLWGLVLRKSGDFAGAEQAFATARDCDPALAPELLDERWRIARATGDLALQLALAEDYRLLYPDGPLTPHYEATILLAAEQPDAAIGVLVAALRDRPNAPAALWYSLGEAYLARQAYAEAATALEVAASETAQGDTSLYALSDEPITDLNIRLGQAYLHTQRCVEAESIFRRLSSQQSDFEAMVEEAVICQTPTPTLTPWMPLMTPYPGDL